MANNDYRKFWLINAKGERYDFTNPESNHTFLNIPSGLGFRREYTSERIGNSEIILSQEFSLLDVTGELVFYNETNAQIYEDYQNFIQFISFRPLELHYQTPNVTALDHYYCEVIITNLDKSEISKDDSTMRCSITFHRLTEWLSGNSRVMTLTNEVLEAGKVYLLQRDYHYSGTSLNGTPIYNEGTDDVGFTIRIDGPVTSPRFYLIQNSQIYGVCGIKGGPYSCVIINSVDEKESIYLETSSQNGPVVVANPKQKQDFSLATGQAYLTWCKLKVGKSTFSFVSAEGSSFAGTITISYKNSYISV